MTPFGLFEFTRMPFGLKNAAQTFQRLMDPATQQLPGVFVYLDDVLVVSKSMEEHVKHLAGLFEALKKFGLIINTSESSEIGDPCAPWVPIEEMEARPVMTLPRHPHVPPPVPTDPNVPKGFIVLAQPVPQGVGHEPK